MALKFVQVNTGLYCTVLNFMYIVILKFIGHICKFM